MGRRRQYATDALRQEAYRARQRGKVLDAFPRVQIGACTLYQGDAAAILPLLREPLHVLLTDPPYGIGVRYASYEDSSDNFRISILPILNASLDRVVRGAVFSAEHLITDQRRPALLGQVYCPAGTGRSAWGFVTSHHVLLYGRSPHRRGGPQTTLTSVKPDREQTAHPCSKPVEWMAWLVALCSLPGETILDPFMGSGSTGVACVEHQRRFIGIELDPEYFALACTRIADATRQGQIFASHRPTARQDALFGP